MAITIPDRLVHPILRALRFNQIFVDADKATRHVFALAKRPLSYAPPKALRSDVRLEPSRRGAWPVYRVTPREGTPQGCVVYAHGGGWVNEIHAMHWRLIAKIAAESNTTVIVPIYPVIPFGTAEEVVGEFVEIVREAGEEYATVKLAGDSAGGQIALSTALELRDRHGITLPVTLLIAPALDLTWSNPEIPSVQPRDPWLGVPGASVFSEFWRGDLPATDQRVSPLSGDLTGLGRLVILVGTDDILMPDARLLTKKAREAGVAFDYYEGADQVHVYPMAPTAAGREARQVIIDNLSSLRSG